MPQPSVHRRYALQRLLPQLLLGAIVVSLLAWAATVLATGTLQYGSASAPTFAPSDQPDAAHRHASQQLGGSGLKAHPATHPETLGPESEPSANGNAPYLLSSGLSIPASSSLYVDHVAPAKRRGARAPPARQSC